MVFVACQANRTLPPNISLRSKPQLQDRHLGPIDLLAKIVGMYGGDRSHDAIILVNQTAEFFKGVNTRHSF